MKIITVQTLLGLQLLNYLANLAPKQRVNIAEVANYYRVSHYHLIKVVGRLNRMGYIQAYRGRGGGILLKQSPDQVRLGQVIRTLEPCHTVIQADSKSSVKFYQSIEYILSIGREAFFIQLNEFTLVDLVIMSD